LKGLARKGGIDSPLAAGLWGTANHAIRLPALMIMDSEYLNGLLGGKWVEDMDNYSQIRI